MSFTRHPDEPKLTAGETAKVAWLIGRMAKRGLAAHNSPTGEIYQKDLEKKVDRVLDQARKREEREAKEAAKKGTQAKPESKWW